MKKMFKLLIICAIISIMPIQVLAQTDGAKATVSKTTETNIFSSNQMSKLIGNARGRLLSSATVQISDEGDGVLGVYANTLCHTDMKDIYITIYLEMLNEKGDSWIQLNSYDYEWHASSPEESLNMTVVSFDIVGLERRREYRLRSMHAGKNFSGLTETMMPRTEAILLR